MGLESIQPTSKPTDLNDAWPVTGDPKSQGDDHIRGIKTVLKNFYTDYLNEIAKFANYFDGDKAKTAKDSDNFGGQPPSYYRDPNNLTGTIPEDRLPKATSIQLGAVTLSSVRDATTNKAATPKLVKDAVDEILASGGTSDVLKWVNVTVTNNRTFTLPAGLLSMLQSGDDVEVMFNMRDNDVVGGQYFSDQVVLFHDGVAGQGKYTSAIANRPLVGWELYLQVTGGGINELRMPASDTSMILERFMYRRAKRA